MSAWQPRFSVEEQVSINAPGWPWDGQLGTVKDARAGVVSECEPLYVVLVRWGDGPRRYNLWQSQLKKAK